ncbi:lipopolysaccharide transport system permease protein [Bradyrhizobium shewense]|uniref:Transport permease protein n=1 Tax=Bradyrhizobium shewense TaxID=1761772 RepID=A0A1C3WRB7_9BRAD|nr:ABC transporter permease [Bradyrhizobium shewense]SCB42577.1 lipopolysaccharide transport system permease protein [Bradyrhizobium shewense]
MAIDPQEYWNARYMFSMLVWKKIRASFGEMYFWFVWLCARPLIYVTIFGLFKRWSEAKTGVELPYTLYIYSGLILWYYFMETSIDVSMNIKANASLITKIYIPRLLTPTVPLIANLLDLIVSAIPLVGMMVYFGVYPGRAIFMILPTLLIVMLMSLGTGLIIAAVTLRLRDFQKVFEFSLYLAMFVSPVIFSPKMIPDRFHIIYQLNPMVGALMGWRAALFGEGFPWQAWLSSLAFAMIAVIVGLYLYMRYEHELVEAI